ncbi:hypothetical protein [Peterkaempfera sp. SMS 1(5)a]|uniref:hypothetical protein n=1 Tax=Peterkaempfera podocarpi TaxID=3232308 RepID=UPI0036708150
MTQAPAELTPQQLAELAPLTRVVARAVYDAPVRFGDGPGALVPHIVVAVAAYMGSVVGPASKE